jgi:hypothetical protein
LVPRTSRRRAAAAIAGLLAVAVLAGGAGIAAAGDGSSKADAVSATDKPAVSKPIAPDPGVPPGLLAETRGALGELVADGTIDQGQADAVQSRVASGSVDTTEVVASGVLDEAQMQRVNDVLRTIKLSYTGP